MSGDGGHGSGNKEHVDAAATVEFAVDDGGVERWDAPMLRIDGHHIGVA